MKKLYLTIIITLISIYGCNNSSKSLVEKTIHVYGNCEKCKARIEKAGKLSGVSEVNWDVNSKLFVFKIDTGIISIDAVLKSIANAGHDNEVYPADDYAYDKLPACCQYERVEH